MNYTSAQRAAIETHDRNVIVIAGAGSGKTRVLADRFVALLQAHPDWPVASLAAITFTEKAALELRARIRAAIDDQIAIAEPGEKRTFWHNRGIELDGARIGTIHSLCASIVRANAAWLEIDPGFEVLDEAESAVMRDAALDETLTILTQQPAGQLFGHYRVNVLRQTLNSALEWDEADLPDIDPDSAMSRFHSLYDESISSAVDTLCRDVSFIEALNWTPLTPPEPPDKLARIWNQIALQRTHLLNNNQMPADALGLLEGWAKAIKLNAGSPAAWHGELEHAKQVLKVIRAGVNAALKEIGAPFGEWDELAAVLIPHWSAAVKLTHQTYRQHKQRAHALDFADLERLARNLLQNDAVRTRYRAEFNHVLVDEFQDTNAAQREIIYGLTQHQPGSLFVVGDPKQAIYGFRGADVAVFEQVRHEIAESGGTEINLDTSFRSHEALVGAYNQAFARLLVRVEGDDYTVAYEPMLSSRLAETHHIPAIEIIALIDRYAPESMQKSAEPMRQLEAGVLAERLAALKNERWPVWDRHANVYRPLEYGDCAVLVRASASMQFIEEAFKDVGIPYVTIAGKGYYDRPEVRDVMSLLSVLYNPADELALATALRSPLYSLSDDALYCVRLSAPEKSLWTALNEMPLEAFHELTAADTDAIRFARESLARLRGLAGRVTVAELIRRALDDTAFPAMLIGLPDGARRAGNLEKLLDMAQRVGQLSLGEFLIWMKDRSDRELREGEAPIETGGAVNIMTIHASKGLEFPVVALFDTSRQRGNSEPPALIWDRQVGLASCVKNENDELVKPVAYRLAERYAKRRESAERLRLLYVSMTRAADRLIVTGRLAQKGEDAVEKRLEDRLWLEQLCTVFDLPNEIPETPPDLFRQRYKWGEVQYHLPGNLSEIAESLATSADTAPEDARNRVSPLEEAPDYVNVVPYEPPLLQSIGYRPDSAARTLTATALAMLGQAHAVAADPESANQQPTRDRFARLRRHLLNAAPPLIPDIALDDAQTASDGRPANRIIGEIVHRALQFGLQVSAPDTADQLKIYAWQVGLTDAMHVNDAVQEAIRLLATNENSKIVQRLRKAIQTYRELPFSLRWGERTINGQIDALFLERGGQWAVLDYKTDDVAADFAQVHSRRYVGQVGVYAAAVEQLTGQAPRVFLHYIRPGVTVVVREADWRAALARLESELQTALAEPQRGH